MNVGTKTVRSFVVTALAAVLAVAAAWAGQAQASGQAEPRPKPALVGQPMPDFTLPVFQGGTLTLSSLRGKNVLLLFPRGYAAKDYWCTICNYQYVELVELEKARKIRETYNLEVLVVFPYPRDVVKTWLEALPAQMESIRATKNPADPSKLDEAGRRRMEGFRRLFPKDFALEKGEAPAPFPVLVDGERSLSKSLGLFQTEWSGSKIEQNIPSIYIVDAAGVLQFKYVGQSTVDRPSYDYLLKVLDVIGVGPQHLK